VHAEAEDNGATTTWTYDPNTGYPLTQKDALANKINTAATTYTYQTSLSGHIADVTDKTSAAGRHWHFAYDAKGNLTSVQDPAGTAAGSGYTTGYTYDSTGQLLTATDASNHTTTYSRYDVRRQHGPERHHHRVLGQPCFPALRRPAQRSGEQPSRAKVSD
jgi:YD repeat-containing protein